jgi:hypothetical protein
VPSRFDLDAIKREYEAARITVGELCRKFGISKSHLSQTAQERGWSRNGRAFRKGALCVPKAVKAAAQRQALAESLYAMLGDEIRALAGRQSDAQSGKELEQLVKCFKTINDLQEALAGPGAARKDPHDGRSAKEIRADLERRLAQRFAARGMDRVP